MLQMRVDLFDGLESLHHCFLEENGNKQRENSRFLLPSH